MVTVSITKCESYEEMDKAVGKCLQDLGGLKRFVRKGQKVLLKPNILADKTPDKAVTTHPALVEAVCRRVKRLGAKIWIGDSTGGFGRITQKALKTSGMEGVAKKCGAKLINFDKCPKTSLNSKSSLLKGLEVAQPILDADVIISLPKLKTHLLTIYTGGVKNVFGCLPGGNKTTLHRRAPSAKIFSKGLVDVYEKITPSLTIMDAVVGMEGDGPGNGDPKHVGLILASDNAIALDMIACRAVGFKPMSIPTNEQGVKRGLCPPLKKVEVIGWDDSMKVRFRKPKTSLKGLALHLFGWMMNQTRPQPLINDKCTFCRMCVEACPETAIIEKNGKAFIHEDKCIKCYCCHEICPANAVSFKKNFFRKALENIKKIKRRG
ncbi:MAG: DUF362 domain-containing protein [Nanoarchaeota archaeon]|nr:DUF362 domain-containing protein [Nanoarchaeota archaeon]